MANWKHKGRTIQGRVETTATPQQAWEAWADPQKVAQWFVDRASGEARPGDTMVWEFEKFGIKMPYQVLEAVPGERLVFEFPSPGGPSGIIEISIRQDGGKTTLTFVNSGFREDAAWDEEYEGMDSGWQMSLAMLKIYVEAYFGQAKRTLLLVRPANFEYASVAPFYAERLSDWLTDEGTLGQVGERADLTFADGSRLSGYVLCRTGREVLVSWPEMQGCLELKTFGGGPGKRSLAIRVTSWEMEEANGRALEEQLGAALGRLATRF